MTNRSTFITTTLPNGTTITLDKKDKIYLSLKNTLYKMKDRCNNTKSKDYKNYGGRGIKCKINTVIEIINTIGLRPDNYTIDRIDNNKDYTTSNIRWATRTTQSRNRRISWLLTIDNVERSIYEWHELLQSPLSIHTIRDRYKYGRRDISLFFPLKHKDVTNNYHRPSNKVS